MEGVSKVHTRVEIVFGSSQAIKEAAKVTGVAKRNKHIKKAFF